MKILKLSTFGFGGAAIAARRQKDAIISAGFNCDFAYVQEDWNASKIKVEYKNSSEIKIKVPATLWSYNFRIADAYCKNNRSELSNTWFSFWQVESFLDQVLFNLCLEYDIVHLHWIAHLVSSKLIDMLLSRKKRIFITGHDMNHFTGGCHYSAGCEQFMEGCKKCPQLLNDPLNLVSESFSYKHDALSKIPASHWIFPSVWLAREFKKSLFCENDKYPNVIYNCIDTEKFNYTNPHDRFIIRKNLGFGNDEIVLIAGASNNLEKRKGFTFIEYSLQRLENFLMHKNYVSNRFVIVTFGHGNTTIKSFSPYIRHQHLGYIDESKMIKLFQAADLLMFPSIEENFSNIVLESLMCGLPVLAFNIGGVPDIVNHLENGFIVDKIDAEDFANALHELMNLENLIQLRKKTEKWRDDNAIRYSYETFAKNLLSLYSESRKESYQVNQKHKSQIKGEIYKAIFRDISFFVDNNDHRMLAANLSQLVQERVVNIPQNKKKIKAIYIGFGTEFNSELGMVSWIKKDSFVIFYAPKETKPALCLIFPNIDWINTVNKKALKNLKALCNGKPVSIKLLEAQSGRNNFIWIIPERESLIFDEFNLLSLTFSEVSVPLDRDPRAICLVHNYAGFFDLSFFETNNQDLILSDWRVSNQLILGADLSHYIYDERTEDKVKHFFISKNLETWIDVMKSTIDQNKG